MKKNVLITIAAFISIFAIIFSCSKQKDTPTDELISKYPFFNEIKDPQPAVYSKLKSAESIKVKIKHDGCDKPLGVCILIPIGSVEESSTLKSAEIDSDTLDIGEVLITITDNQVLLLPHVKCYFSDEGYYENTVPIDHDVNIPVSISKNFGYKSVTIEKGLYRIHFEKNKKFGELYLNAITLK